MATLRKLTLSIDENVIERARQYSKRHGVSISRLVTNYLAGLGARSKADAISPSVRRLRGILPPDTSVERHKKYLEDKYRG